jgi:thiol-disulfide isomerase/thioredoxin
MRILRTLLMITTIFFLGSCSGEGGEGVPVADGDGAAQVSLEGAIEVTLSAQLPDREAGRGMRWSPYGQQLRLVGANGGMETLLDLGPAGTQPMGLRLIRSEGSEYFDQLFVDLNRDGSFDSTEMLETEVSESRNKFWSSFDAVVGVPVTDPETGGRAVNPYPLSLWYVEDPRVPDEEPVIRYSRDGWMEGTLVLDGVETVILVTERVMDGVFSSDDSWALASRDSAADIFNSGYSRSLDEHAWLFEQAYKVVQVDPSGRQAYVIPFDPGMTRSEEIAMNDDLAVDRNAPRSGRTVAFLHDFEAAEAAAKAQGKALFVDFETTWCGPCKIMDEWVYTADGVVAAAQTVVAVKVDGDERLDLKDRFGVTGFPTLILLDAEGGELGRASGYVNVADMTEFLKVGG